MSFSKARYGKTQIEGREKSWDTIGRSLSTEFGFCVIFFWVSQGGCLKIMLKFYPHILRGNVWRYPPCNYSQQFRGYGWLLLIVRNQFWNPLEASNLRVQKKHEHVSAGGRVRALRYESVWMSRVARCVTEWHKGVSVFPGWESEQNLKKRAYPPYIQTYHLKIDLWKRR